MKPRVWVEVGGRGGSLFNIYIYIYIYICIYVDTIHIRIAYCSGADDALWNAVLSYMYVRRYVLKYGRYDRDVQYVQYVHAVCMVCTACVCRPWDHVMCLIKKTSGSIPFSFSPYI